MNFKVVLTSAVLASSLAIGGAAMAQANPQSPDNPGGMSQPGQRPDGMRGGPQGGMPGQNGGPGFGQRGGFGPGMMGGGEVFSLLEEYTGLSVDELRDALQSDQTIADLIAANDLNVDDFTAAALEQISTQLDAAVEAGRLTEEQAAEQLAQVEENLAAWINGESESFGFGPGFGPRGPQDGFGLRSGAILDVVQEYTGLTAAEVRDAMQDGQTLSELIEANDQSVDDFAAAVLEQVSTELDAQVEAGRLTEDQAAERLAQTDEFLDNWLSGDIELFAPNLGMTLADL
jgi:hypothetical protein